MVPSATPARSAISDTREWKKPCSAMTSIAASRMRWYLSEVPFTGLAIGSVERFTAGPRIYLDFRTKARKSWETALDIPVETPAESLAAMAVLALLLETQLGEGRAERREVEERIVAKSARALGSCDQFAVGFAIEGGERLAVAG